MGFGAVATGARRFAVMVISSGAIPLLAFGLIPLWGTVGAAAAFGLGQARAIPFFLADRLRNGGPGAAEEKPE